MHDWRGAAVVLGSPQSMGSKRIGRRRDGSPVILDQNDWQLRSWQAELKASMCQTAPEVPWRLPIRLDVRVFVMRPLSHYRRWVDTRTGKKGRFLRTDIPPVPPSGRDLDKILRACGDCGSGIWYVDDRLIADARIRRLYTENQPRTEVRAMLAWAPAEEEVWQEALVFA